VAARVGSVSAEAGGVPGEAVGVQSCCNFSEVEGVDHPAEAAGAVAGLVGGMVAAVAAHHVHG
jgi:hypothetical protein